MNLLLAKTAWRFLLTTLHELWQKRISIKHDTVHLRIVKALFVTANVWPDGVNILR